MHSKQWPHMALSMTLVVSPTIRVELDDFDVLNQLVLERGARSEAASLRAPFFPKTPRRWP